MSISEARIPPCEPAVLKQETHRLPTTTKRNNFVKAAQFFNGVLQPGSTYTSVSLLARACVCVCDAVMQCKSIFVQISLKRNPLDK